MAKPNERIEPRPGPEAPSRASDIQSTRELLDQSRGGNARARNELVERYLPVLHRWAHGRLPGPIRDVNDTGDLVMETFARALKRLDRFEPRHPGAFFAYLRQILMNAIRDEMRRASRRPGMDPLDSGEATREPSPLEELIGRDALERYDRALESLPPRQKAAVILRIEFGFSHREIAAELDCSSADAARMLVARALVSLSAEIHET